MNLSAAFGMRPRGDPAWNRDRSIAYLTEALHLVSNSDDRDSWAAAQTNLAHLLILRGDTGDHDRAREHLELTLTHRSRRRNARDWAFTQLHLGLAYSRADIRRPPGQRSESYPPFRQSPLRGARCRRRSTPCPCRAQSRERAVRYSLKCRTLHPAYQSRLLDRAEASAIEAARLSPTMASPLRFGRAWLLIGKIRSARADKGGAIEAFKTALTALSADTGPSDARDASRFLAALAEEQGDFETRGRCGRDARRSCGRGDFGALTRGRSDVRTPRSEDHRLPLRCACACKGGSPGGGRDGLGTRANQGARLAYADRTP